MRTYRVTRGVERDLEFRGLSGTWIMAFLLGAMLLVVLTVLLLTGGASALWIIPLAAFLMAAWAIFCVRMGRKYPKGYLERLMALHLMPRCLLRRRHFRHMLSEDGTAPVMPNRRLFLI